MRVRTAWLRLLMKCWANNAAAGGLRGAVHSAAAAAVAAAAEVSGLRSIACLLAGSPTRCDRHTFKGSARRLALLLPLSALPPPCPALNGAQRGHKRIECALSRHRTRRRRYWASCLAAGVPPSRLRAGQAPAPAGCSCLKLGTPHLCECRA